MELEPHPELRLRQILIKNRLPVTDGALQLLGRYTSSLLMANKSLNLISRRDEENIWDRHILHCLSTLFILRFPEGASVLDLGSGGGLPGIPLKIMCPALKLTMVDSTKKKVSAVQQMVAELGLKDVQAIWARAEDLGRDSNFKERFDIVTARAVGPLQDLVHLAHPLLKKAVKTSGARDELSRPTLLTEPCLVAYKGGDLERELEKATRIRYVRSVKVMPIVFDGSENIALEDKKLVVVTFT